MGARGRSQAYAILAAAVVVLSGCGGPPSSGPAGATAASEPSETPAGELSARDRDMALAAETVADDVGIEVEDALAQLRAQDELHDVDTSWDPGFLEISSTYGPDYGVRWVTETEGIEDRARQSVDAAVGLDFHLDYRVATLDLGDLKAAAKRVRVRVPASEQWSSSLDVVTGEVVFYKPEQPALDVAEAVEEAALPAGVRWEEGRSMAY